MQIHAANMFYRYNTGSNLDMRVGNSSPFRPMRAKDSATAAGSVFGAECRVTISSEGRKLSGQMKAEEPERFRASGAERALIRQQRQKEEHRSEQSSLLDEISEMMGSIQNAYAAGEDKETIANKQDALNKLLELKARQDAENDQRTKDAQASAAGASREQEIVDQKNADLYMMLKSFEEQEEGEQETGGEKGASDTADAEGSADNSDAFSDAAATLGVSAARRELEARGTIDSLARGGFDKLSEANAMMREIQAEIGLAAEAAGRENLSEDERNQLITEHIGRAGSMMVSNYGEMSRLRKSGLQAIQDARELELRHIELTPLDGVDKAKQTILDMGARAALSEVSHNTLDEASEALEERVQEALDRRNDVTSGADEDGETQEAREKAEEAAREKAEAQQERIEHEKQENRVFDELIV